MLHRVADYNLFVSGLLEQQPRILVAMRVLSEQAKNRQLAHSSTSVTCDFIEENGEMSLFWRAAG